MSTVLTLSSYSPQDYPKFIHFDRQVTNCFMKMCLLISRVCRWSHQHLSSDQVWDFVCHFLGNIRRHSEDMWTLGVCDFFNCLKNVKSCIEIIHFRDDFYKKSSIFNFLLAILYFFNFVHK